MKDTEVTSYSICSSMDKSINEMIDKLRGRIEKNKEKLSGKVGFIDKMSMNGAIKDYQEQIRRLTELSQALGDLRFSDNKKYKLPEKVVEHINGLYQLLTDDEKNALKQNVSIALSNSNKDKKEKVQTMSAKIQKMIAKLGLSTKGFLVYDKTQYKTSISYEQAIKTVEREMLKNLTPEFVSLQGNKMNIELPLDEKTLLNYIKNMVENKELEKSKSVNAIVDNLAQIEDAMNTRERCKLLLLKISNTLFEINNITEIDVTIIKQFLTKLENKYNAEQEKANKFIMKFDFTNVKNQIEEKKKVEEREAKEKHYLTMYENLAYELEKVMTEDPSNYDKIQEIQSQMRACASSYGFSESQLDGAKTNGKIKYHEAVRDQKLKVAAVQEKIAYENELRKGVMAQIREEAIRELERNKAFDEDYEIVNGDVRSMAMDKEGMIKRKMEELMCLAEMTSEERGLYDLKKRGIIKPDATIDDLTAQQLNDIRIGYSDESYEFLADYKTWKSRENVKPQANTIYKEYIKYRANLQNKNDFLSFSEFAKQKHNLEQMSEIMVDANLKEEMAETLKGTGR